jgi:hypothetical protein
MSGIDRNTYYGKISKLGRVFNKLDPNQVREAIEIAQANFNKDIRKVSNVHLQDNNLDVPYVSVNRRQIENEEER